MSEIGRVSVGAAYGSDGAALRLPQGLPLPLRPRPGSQTAPVPAKPRGSTSSHLEPRGLPGGPESAGGRSCRRNSLHQPPREGFEVRIAGRREGVQRVRSAEASGNRGTGTEGSRSQVSAARWSGLRRRSASTPGPVKAPADAAPLRCRPGSKTGSSVRSASSHSRDLQPRLEAASSGRPDRPDKAQGAAAPPTPGSGEGLRRAVPLVIRSGPRYRAGHS